MGEAANTTTSSHFKLRFRETLQYAMQPLETMSTNSPLPGRVLQHIDQTIQEKLAVDCKELEAIFDHGCQSLGIYDALDQLRELGVKGVHQTSEVEGDGASAAMVTAARIQVLKEKREALKRIAMQTGERAGQLHLEVSGRRKKLDKALEDLNTKLSGVHDEMDLDK